MTIFSDHHVWRQHLDRAAQAIGQVIVSYCSDLNTADNPRYFHANTHAAEDPSSLWRLKVVNSSRDDHPRIRKRITNNNCVHARLNGCRSMRAFVSFPDIWKIPENELDNLGCAEFVAGETPTAAHVALVVLALIELRVNRQQIVADLCTPQPGMQHLMDVFGWDQYRKRVRYSIDGLQSRHLLVGEDARAVLETFDKIVATRSQAENAMTFVHGDFSFGNMIVRNHRLVLYDFEHSHMGIPEIDIGHLYVNMLAGGQDAQAKVLLERYESEATLRGLEFDRIVFQAAVLERVAGKMNSLVVAEGDEWERLAGLLRLTSKVL
jgi:hypothetical protein